MPHSSEQVPCQYKTHYFGERMDVGRARAILEGTEKLGRGVRSQLDFDDRTVLIAHNRPGGVSQCLARPPLGIDALEFARLAYADIRELDTAAS